MLFEKPKLIGMLVSIGASALLTSSNPSKLATRPGASSGDETAAGIVQAATDPTAVSSLAHNSGAVQSVPTTNTAPGRVTVAAAAPAAVGTSSFLSGRAITDDLEIDERALLVVDSPAHTNNSLPSTAPHSSDSAASPATSTKSEADPAGAKLSGSQTDFAATSAFNLNEDTGVAIAQTGAGAPANGATDAVARASNSALAVNAQFAPAEHFAASEGVFVAAVPIPEPSTWYLLIAALGLVGVLSLVRSRRDRRI